MKTYVLGDIHANYNALIEVLTKANFDYENDQLISLGDIVDRGTEPYLCIFELQKIKNLIAIKGNHDVWLKDYINQDSSIPSTTASLTTIKWQGLDVEDKRKVEQFLNSQIDYYIDKNNNLFVHAGIDRMETMKEQLFSTLVYDRHFIDELMSMQKMKHLTKIPTISDFNEIFVGHNATIQFKIVNDVYKKEKGWNNLVLDPIHIHNVWMMDTGCGFQVGKLTLMNVETKECFQSEIKQLEKNGDN